MFIDVEEIEENPKACGKLSHHIIFGCRGVGQIL
jgi:hypothetical protein